MNTLKPVLYSMLMLFLLASCMDEDDNLNITGKRPIYIDSSALIDFEQQPVQPIVDPGKIMVYGHYLFLNEINKGIHIIDISDTLHPQKISFLKIPGNKDLVAQNNRLYADNGPHLLVLDISNIQSITLVERQENVFSPSEVYPKEFTGYFECYDQQKGWLIGWEDATLESPKCKR